MDRWTNAFTYLNADTQRWTMSVASQDIALAIEIGMMAITRARSEIQPTKTTRAPIGNPVVAGLSGESKVESILREEFAEVTNVARSSHSGDLALFLRGHKIVVEVKNYTGPVPNTEVEKFRRDLSTSAASGGLFISLRSPITRITNDFAMRYETVECDVVPCAYINSEDPRAIILAAHMVINMVDMQNQLRADVRSKDQMELTVARMVDLASCVSRLKDDLRGFSAEALSKHSKLAQQIMQVERTLKAVTNDMREEIAYQGNTLSAVGQILEKQSAYAKYPAPTKKLILRIMEAMDIDLANLGGRTWKITAKKCTHATTSLGITFFAAQAEVNLPRTMVTDAQLMHALYNFKGTTASSSQVNVALTDHTVEWILSLLPGNKSESTQ